MKIFQLRGEISVKMLLCNLFCCFFLLKVCSSKVQEIVSDGRDCTPDSMIISEINWNYFDAQHSVSLIDKTSEPIGILFKCSKEKQYRPFYKISDIRFINVSPRKDSISPLPTTNGFFIRTKSQTDVRELIKIISSQNSLSKLMILLLNGTHEEAREILDEAFQVYKILNVAVLLTDENSLIELVMQNPYGKVKTPQIVTYKFSSNDEDAQRNIFKMKKFMKLRVKNLNGHSLKVNIFDFPMISKVERDKSGKISHYSYVDGDSLTAMAKIMNFTPIYDENVTGKYGSQFVNGTFSGSLADLEYERVELAVNPRLISDQYNIISFSTAHYYGPPLFRHT
jgi:arsenate reductase-like glutaredoxin family protein